MSYFLANDAFVRSMDPRVDFDRNAIYAITDASNKIQYCTEPVNSVSDQAFNINVRVPSNIAVDRKLFVRAQYEVTMKRTVEADGYVFKTQHDAPRFMPFNQCCNTLTVNIGGQAFSEQINDYANALMHYNNTFNELDNYMSACPSMQDTYQQYGTAQVIGTNVDPLQEYGGSSTVQHPRGGFTIDELNGNGPYAQGGVVRTATLKFTTFEPLLISPLLWGKICEKAMHGVDTYNFNFSFDNLNRCWSHSLGNEVVDGDKTGPPIVTAQAGLEITAKFVTNSVSLSLIKLTPKLTSPMRDIQLYPYYRIQRETQDTIVIDSDESRIISTGTINLVGCPSRVYIFAQRRKQDRTPFTSDTFAVIDKLSVVFDNESGIFSQALPQQLHQISVSNGSKQNWTAWNEHEGSVFCMDFSKDVPLSEGVAPGVKKAITMSYDITLRNSDVDYSPNSRANYALPAAYNGGNKAYMLTTIIVYEGLISVDSYGSVYCQDLPIKELQVVESMQLPRISPNDISFLEGAGFGSTIRKVASTAKKAYDSITPEQKSQLYAAAKSAANIGVDALGTVLPRAAQLARTLGSAGEHVYNSLKGSGLSEDQIYAYLKTQENVGGVLKNKKKKAKKAAKGGALVTRANLSKKGYLY